jgi:NAD+ kinase
VVADRFRNIGLVARAEAQAGDASLRALVELLQHHGCHVILEESLAPGLEDLKLQAGSRTQLGESCDLVIVVGGDGRLLGAARTFARHDVPVLGINRGRLGFLTDIRPAEIDTRIGQVLGGDYHIEERFLLDMEVRRGRTAIGEGSALNDVVLLSGESVHMIEFELFIDGDFVYNQRSDGLIVATPTGSTAYALSGGGPIMHPKLDAMVLVPLNPHTLTSRPLVVGGNSEIKIRLTSPELKPLVSCDGQEGVRLQHHDEIRVGKKPHRLKLLHPPGHNFYEACRSKLSWSSSPGES